MTQIVIVGAGPTGASMALLLVKQGITVKLIEASPDFQRKFRGEGLMPSGLAALEEMGLLSLLEKIPHRRIDRWEVMINRRSLFSVKEPFEAGEQPCTLVSQPHLLEGIVAEASNYPSFEFIRGEPVRGLLTNEEGRVAGVSLSQNKEIAADLVIAADGRNSAMRKQAGIELFKLSSAIDILWFKLSSGSLLATENTFYSIVQDKAAFGLFKSSEGDLHIGWGLYKDDDCDWKNIDWRTKLASVAPDWLAEHIQAETTTITSPLLLSVVVGRCSRWSKPGLILLGDAAHPMSPIRAQGINMALRDALVTSHFLIPLLQNNPSSQDIDRILPQIQQIREPEIIRIQQLQNEELAQAEKLRKYGILRLLVSKFAPFIGSVIRFSWLKRQKKLRLS